MRSILQASPVLSASRLRRMLALFQLARAQLVPVPFLLPVIGKCCEESPPIEPSKGEMFRAHTNCNGVTRRDFIQLGLGGVLGLGFCDVLRLRAGEAAASPKAKLP